MKEFGRYPDEFTLMRHFSNGDKPAFTSLYEQYHFRVFEFAERYLPTTEDAKDITADSFVKLWNERGTINSLDHLRAFLFTTTRNACIDFLRHDAIKNKKHADILLTLLDHQRENFHVEEVRAGLLELVFAELDKLPPKMKEIFLLSYKEGLKPAEIAVRLGISPKTVWNQKVNAVNLLKTALGHNTLLLALLCCLDSMAVGPQNWNA